MPEFSTLVVRSYLAADVTYNNTAALANTLLSVTVEAGKKYKIELVAYSTNAVRGLKLDFGGTATVTNFIGDWLVSRTPTPLADISTLVQDALTVSAPGTDFESGALNGGEPGKYVFVGSMEVNAAGTFLLRGAQNSADASNTTILRGSTLVLTKMD